MVIETHGMCQDKKRAQCDDVSQLLAQKKKKNTLSQEERLQLHNLQVRLLHKVLPQHEIEARAGSHVPTASELERFTKIIPLKRGPYSSDEDKIIIKNWSQFCETHDWNKNKLYPFLVLRDDNKSYIYHKFTRRKFVQFLANGLPNRTLYSVYHRFRLIFSNNILRRYTKEEDKLILNHLENNPHLNERRKLIDLAKVLSRTRQSIWRRYERLKKYRNQDLLRFR